MAPTFHTSPDLFWSYAFVRLNEVGDYVEFEITLTEEEADSQPAYSPSREGGWYGGLSYYNGRPSYGFGFPPIAIAVNDVIIDPWTWGSYLTVFGSPDGYFDDTDDQYRFRWQEFWVPNFNGGSGPSGETRSTVADLDVVGSGWRPGLNKIKFIRTVVSNRWIDGYPADATGYTDPGEPVEIDWIGRDPYGNYFGLGDLALSINYPIFGIPVARYPEGPYYHDMRERHALGTELAVHKPTGSKGPRWFFFPTDGTLGHLSSTETNFTVTRLGHGIWNFDITVTSIEGGTVDEGYVLIDPSATSYNFWSGEAVRLPIVDGHATYVLNFQERRDAQWDAFSDEFKASYPYLEDFIAQWYRLDLPVAVYYVGINNFASSRKLVYLPGPTIIPSFSVSTTTPAVLESVVFTDTSRSGLNYGYAGRLGSRVFTDTEILTIYGIDYGGSGTPVTATHAYHSTGSYLAYRSMPGYTSRDGYTEPAQLFEITINVTGTDEGANFDWTPRPAYAEADVHFDLEIIPTEIGVTRISWYFNPPGGGQLASIDYSIDRDLSERVETRRASTGFATEYTDMYGYHDPVIRLPVAGTWTVGLYVYFGPAEYRYVIHEVLVLPGFPPDPPVARGENDFTWTVTGAPPAGMSVGISQIPEFNIPTAIVDFNNYSAMPTPPTPLNELWGIEQANTGTASGDWRAGYSFYIPPGTFNDFDFYEPWETDGWNTNWTYTNRDGGEVKTLEALGNHLGEIDLAGTAVTQGATETNVLLPRHFDMKFITYVGDSLPTTGNESIVVSFRSAAVDDASAVLNNGYALYINLRLKKLTLFRINGTGGHILLAEADSPELTNYPTHNAFLVGIQASGSLIRCKIGRNIEGQFAPAFQNTWDINVINSITAGVATGNYMKLAYFDGLPTVLSTEGGGNGSGTGGGGNGGGDGGGGNPPGQGTADIRQLFLDRYTHISTEIVVDGTSINDAIDLLTPGGGTILVKNGTYTPINIIGKNFTQNLLILNYPGHTPLISSVGHPDAYGLDNAILIADSTNVGIFGLEAQAYNASGHQYADACSIRNSHHIYIWNNDLHDGTHGIGSGDVGTGPCNHLDFCYNIIHNCAGWLDSFGSGITMYKLGNVGGGVDSDGYTNRIVGNVVYDCENDPSYGGITDGNGIIIDIANGTYATSPVNFTGRTLILNNICADNGGRGVHALFSRNTDIIFNTVAYNLKSSTMAGDGELSSIGSENNTMMGNISLPSVGRENWAMTYEAAINIVDNVVLDGTNPAIGSNFDHRDVGSAYFIAPNIGMTNIPGWAPSVPDHIVVDAALLNKIQGWPDALRNYRVGSTWSAGAIEVSSSGGGTGSTSGVSMPTVDPPGWHIIFSDDFAEDTAVGTWGPNSNDAPGSYAGKWSMYPDNTPDTAAQNEGAPSRYYPSQVISTSNSCMVKHLHQSGGINMAAAMIPKIGGTDNQLYGRYDVRFKSDIIHHYKIAWLLWPQSETWPRDGEIDFPEAALDGFIGGYMHRQGATVGGDQDGVDTTVNMLDWHTATMEWTATSCKFILDGVTIGNFTSRIPSTPMHYVMQTETCIGNCQPSSSDGGYLYVDWIVIYAPA